MKTTLINSMVSFTLGTGAALVALASWTGTSNLNDIKQAVEQYTVKVDEQVSALLGEYNVVVENANAEIEEYQVALEQANSNISQLITAYESKVTELENANTTYEQDLAELEQALADMENRMNSQYEQDMNEVIEQANAEINQANEEVGETKEQVQRIIDGSGINQYTIDDHLGHVNQLDTTGDKSVQDISSVVPQEQPAE